MTINCEKLNEIVANFSLVKECDRLADGTLRIATPFQYPNGSFIDVFLQDGTNLPDDQQNLFCGHLLSDLGQTATYLLDMHIKFSTTKRKRQIVEDICIANGVNNKNGELHILVEPDHADQIAPAIVKLAQACSRIADLSHMQRFPLIPTFRDQVEEIIDTSAVDYETDAPLNNIFGNETVVDFMVRGRSKRSLIKTISTNSIDVAHRQLLEAFSRWHDLTNQKDRYQFLTVVEDKPIDLYQQSDLNRIEKYSDVIYFPSEEERLIHTLAA